MINICKYLHKNTLALGSRNWSRSGKEKGPERGFSRRDGESRRVKSDRSIAWRLGIQTGQKSLERWLGTWNPDRERNGGRERGVVLLRIEKEGGDK
ncbi:hypothetical protein ACH5RR_030269 [Cinchona calisaya]|uniref:Uncharacterized protein n=1 Tax=Cinchona calisaya TaxID=153742 RepID=A0ABD2YU68_9GENT